MGYKLLIRLKKRIVSKNMWKMQLDVNCIKKWIYFVAVIYKWNSYVYQETIHES